MSVSIDLTDEGILRVTGSPNNDILTVYEMTDGRVVASATEKDDSGRTLDTINRILSPGKVKGVHIRGGSGNDLLSSLTSLPCTIMGEDGNDLIYGGKGDDCLAGGGGTDVISGDKGDDTIEGGPGNDQLVGGEGGDVLRGGEGNDNLYGGPGNDTLRGGPGSDLLSGGSGQNDVSG